MTAPKADPVLQFSARAVDVRGFGQSIGHWFQLHGVEILLATGAGILLYLALGGIKVMGKRLCDRSGGQMGLGAVIGRAFARTTHFFMIMVAARLVASYATPPAAVFRTIEFLFTVAAVFQGAIWLREIILGLIERRTGEDGHSETLANAMGIIRLLVTVALFAVAIIVVLDNLGVNVTGLIAGLGVGGIAIGLAAQGIFSDLFAALSIIFDKPFRRGETINYDTTTATVERIGLKSTRLRAITGERKVISNANLLQKEITSYLGLEQRRVKFTLGLVYWTPVETLERFPEIMREVVDADEAARFLHAGITMFGASSIDFDVEFDIPQPDVHDYFMTRHRLGLAIFRRLQAEKIDLAYPTQTSFTAAPDGGFVMPYPDVMPVDVRRSGEAVPPTPFAPPPTRTGEE